MNMTIKQGSVPKNHGVMHSEDEQSSSVKAGL